MDPPCQIDLPDVPQDQDIRHFQMRERERELLFFNEAAQFYATHRKEENRKLHFVTTTVNLACVIELLMWIEGAVPQLMTNPFPPFVLTVVLFGKYLLFPAIGYSEKIPSKSRRK